MKEIGSEFWLEDINVKKCKVKNDSKKVFLLSGRTAIDYALNIIQSNKKINKVYFPSYCCQSMIAPFVEKGIELEFYMVSFKDGNLIYNIDCNKKCDVFFAMNYFGFSQYSMDYYIEKFKERNILVIEDSTHSLFSKRKFNTKSDFVLASLRKWLPIISGGILLNRSKEFNKIDIHLKDNFSYVTLKEEAMIEKGKYINKKENVNKEEFLKKFAKTDKILDNDYQKYNIDKKSYNILYNIDIDEIIEKRRKNAKKIYEYLTSQEEIKYLKKINLEEDCPIFVPIFLKNERRNSLKKYLIENKVYCSNHWKIPKKINNEKEKNIYNMELSLICDQRYEEEKIEKYLNLLCNEEKMQC